MRATCTYITINLYVAMLEHYGGTTEDNILLSGQKKLVDVRPKTVLEGNYVQKYLGNNF